ncbi:MAG: hypothetical protein V4772_26555 [Pseudomonadota bacterium]
MKHQFCKNLLATVALLMSIQCQAIDVKPFDGIEGYQEIKVTAKLYYVGFHGKRDAKYTDVLSAWEARSAQICAESGASHFVQLKSLLEPLTQKELEQFVAYEPAPYPTQAAASFIYIPIYMPSGPRAAQIDGPSKLAAVRCVHSTEVIVDRDRLTAVVQTAK